MIISRSRPQNLMRTPQLTKRLGIGAVPEASRRGCAYRARLEAEFSCAGVAPDLLTVLVPAEACCRDVGSDPRPARDNPLRRVPRRQAGHRRLDTVRRQVWQSARKLRDKTIAKT